MLIEVFEGDRASTRDCNKLGELTLYDIPPMPEGKAEIEVAFDVDASGVLNVRAWRSRLARRPRVSSPTTMGA